MPGEALQADSKAAAGSSGGGGAPSAVPLRILNKGPEYFRRQADANPKRLSAVERLEADKAKYVKSQEVINARQEPVKPPATSSSPGGGPKRPSLRRSKSDLSERHARAEADLERFFNQCGLEPEELERLGLQGLAGSDIVSLNLHSASTAGSEPGGRGSRRSDEEDDDEEDEEEEDLMDEEDEEDRVPYGISAVERNARVIKWLYSIRQNRESQRVSHV